MPNRKVLLVTGAGIGAATADVALIYREYGKKPYISRI